MTIYAVNSKEPIACWIPSLDTAGNGTGTLNDLIGSNHSTLTNGPTWQADTGAGGVRAIEFDGTNDHGLTTYGPVMSAFSVSCWVKVSTIVTTSAFVAQSDSGIGNTGSWALGIGTSSVFRFSFSDGVSLKHAVSVAAVTTGTWFHVVGTYSGSAVVLWVNGTSSSTAASAASTNTTRKIVQASRNGSSNFLTGRGDDWRLFNSVLDSTDVGYLYNSGNGRGRTSSGASYRRNHPLIGC